MIFLYLLDKLGNRNNMTPASIFRFVWSFFVHSDFFLAFRAAPLRFYDYLYNKTDTKLGFGQQVFEIKRGEVKAALKLTKLKLDSHFINLESPFQVVDKVFYWINHQILSLELERMNKLHDTFASWGRDGLPDLATYFQQQQADVS